MAISQLPSPSARGKRRQALYVATAALWLTLLSCSQTGPAADGVDSPPPPAAAIASEQVRAIAQAAMPSIRDLVNGACGGNTSVECSQEPFPKAGFNSAEELESAQVGTPVEMVVLPQSAVRAFQPGQALATLVTPRHVWRVPIEVNGEARSSLDVRWSGGRWEVARCCGQQAATANLVAIQRQHMQRSAPVKLVEVPIGRYYAWVPSGTQDLLILLGAPPYYSFTEQDLTPYPASELLPKLAELLGPDTPGER